MNRHLAVSASAENWFMQFWGLKYKNSANKRLITKMYLDLWVVRGNPKSHQPKWHRESLKDVHLGVCMSLRQEIMISFNTWVMAMQGAEPPLDPCYITRTHRRGLVRARGWVISMQGGCVFIG